jgi:myo-inositol-1(or 4)-monophosphatase
MPGRRPRVYGQLVPLLAKYSKFANMDDKLRASDRVRAVSASTKSNADDASVDLYARSTVADFADEQAEGAAAPAPAPAPAPRKLTRVRRDAPATGTGPSEGNASFK